MFLMRRDKGNGGSRGRVFGAQKWDKPEDRDTVLVLNISKYKFNVSCVLQLSGQALI